MANERLILASASPRRSELMRRMGLSFEVIVSDAEQSGLVESDPAEFALLQARFKARDIARSAQGIIIAADTVVSIDSAILGKPVNDRDAARMLTLLSAREHIVFTALVALHGERELAFVSSTRVEFAEMTTHEIEYYVKTGEPMDKAGAYGIQELGMRYIRSISGDYFTVCGLPVRKLYEFLSELGYFER